MTFLDPQIDRMFEGRHVRSRLRMAGAHFVFLALVSLALSFATPPFQVPDEHQHFFRAFQLSEGTLKGETRDGRSGGVLPASLGELAATYLGSPAAHLQTREIQKFPAETTWTRLSTPLNPERREFLDFTGAAPYAPLAYAPQVVGIEIGRLFGAGVLTLLFLARAANALAAALLMATAGLILPYGQLLLIGASSCQCRWRCSVRSHRTHPLLAAALSSARSPRAPRAPVAGRAAMSRRLVRQAL